MEPKQPHYFTFNINSLRPGDVILTRGGGKPAEWIIRTCGGHYSHALLVGVGGVCIEAVEPQVQRYDLKNAYLNDKNRILILRPKESCCTQYQAQLAADEANRLYSKSYSVDLAIKSKLPLTGKINQGVFCSMLIGLSFLHSGANLFGRIEPHKLKPVDIENSKSFEDITNHILIPVFNSDQPLHLERIDGERRSTPGRELAKIQNQIYKNVCDEFGPSIHKIFGESSSEGTYFGLIRFLSECLIPNPSLPTQFVQFCLSVDEFILQQIEEHKIRNKYVDMAIMEEEGNDWENIPRSQLIQLIAATEKIIVDRQKSCESWKPLIRLSKAKTPKTIYEFDRYIIDRQKRRIEKFRSLLND